MKEKIKQIQKKLGVQPDGIIGAKTVAAMCAALGITEEDTQKTLPTQKEVRSGKSVYGAPGSGKLVRITPPYQLYYEGGRVSTIAVHERVKDAVLGALKEVLAVYGRERIRELRLDEYGGCYNYRKATGGGGLSMHSWGIALDFMPEGNGYNTKAPEAVLSGAEYAAWFDIWERHGAVSLGRIANKDWMHLQFARIK